MGLEPLKLRTTAEGVLLAVRAKPSSRKNELRGIHQGALKVSVTAAPEKGKANQAVVATLAKLLDLRNSQIALATGATQSEKEFLIRDMTEQELRQRIDQALQRGKTPDPDRHHSDSHDTSTAQPIAKPNATDAD